MEVYIVIIFIPLILLLFLAFGIFTVISERRIRTKGIETLANVVKIEEIKSQQDYSYKLYVEFVNKRGKTISQAIDDTVSNRPPQELPFKIPIIYLEHKGKLEIVLSKNKTMLFIGIAVSLFAIVLLILFAFYAVENF